MDPGAPAKQQLQELQELYKQCWQTQVSDESSPRDAKISGKLNLDVVDGMRLQIAEMCFSQYAVVSETALRCLLRVLEAMPVGHHRAAKGLMQLVELFMEQLPPKSFESLPFDAFTQVVHCMFVLLEAIRAEHLVANLPAISTGTRESIFAYVEQISGLNTRNGNTTQSYLVGQAGSLEAQLWIDALQESVKRLQVNESHAVELVALSADVVGAAIKLYNGDVAAGLQGLRAAFRLKGPNFPWFENVVLLRRLCADAISDEVVFRQIRWTLAMASTKAGRTSDLSSDPWHDTFNSHMVLCLSRLVEEGVTELIREGSLQLLTQLATSDQAELQLLASSAVEGLSRSEEEKVKSTARVLLAVLERTVLNPSRDHRLQDFAARLRSRWEVDKASPASSSHKYKGYISPISALFNKLDEYGTTQEEEDTSELLFQAMGVSSKHARSIRDALQRVLLVDISEDAYFKEVDKNSGLCPIHRACANGVHINVDWMLRSALNASPASCRELVTWKTPGGRQPCHYAGSWD